jgi:hypothetical protein
VPNCTNFLVFPRTCVEGIGPQVTTDTKTFGLYLLRFQALAEPGMTMKISGLRTDRLSGAAKLERLGTTRQSRA